MQAKVTDSELQSSEAPQPQHQLPAYQAESTGPSGAGETIHAQVPSPPHPSMPQQSAPNPLVCTCPFAQSASAASSLLGSLHPSIVTHAHCQLLTTGVHLPVCTCIQCTHSRPVLEAALVAFRFVCLSASLTPVRATIPGSTCCTFLLSASLPACP